MENSNNLISNCPLCENHTLSIINNDVNQCMFCGYTTSSMYKGTSEDNEYYKALPDEFKEVIQEKNGYIWIPTVMTLPMGILKHLLVDDEMFWSFKPLIDDGSETPNYDNTKIKLFKEFHIALEELNKLYMEQNEPKEKQIKLPKLKKVDA